MRQFTDFGNPISPVAEPDISNPNIPMANSTVVIDDRRTSTRQIEEKKGKKRKTDRQTDRCGAQPP